MSSKFITEGIYYVGILNPNLRVFDIVMSTDYGTTYNSYVVKGTDKTALIETCHKTYTKQYIENIKEVCGLEEIDYIILNHNEPDHSGSLAEILNYMPKATVVASQAGSIYIKNITNSADIKVTVAKNGDAIDLGGKTLKFINAPFLHWPDSMFTWIEESKTLFSCDFFGSHYCEPYTFDYNVSYNKAYETALKGYYDAIFGPFKPYVLAGLEKIKDLDIKFVCTSHGPILTADCRLEFVKAIYKQWSMPHKNEVTTIPVFYTSAYGNTRLIAKSIADGISDILPDAKITTFDIIKHDITELQVALNTSDAFAIGSPTINKDAVPPTWNLLSHVDAINNQKKNALVFGSFGWSGEAVPNIVARLQGLKINVFGEGFKVIFVPSEEDLKKAHALGSEFAKTLK